MKTTESSSWNKKWHLKEGNIVNDNKELSLNPTTKNNLNADLEFSESPTQENPQNLIRYRRANGDNNQPPSIFVPVDVPGDGSCLFWATTLAYLIPVEDDSAVFAERFKRLFGAEESGNIKHIRELIREYDPFSNNVRSDRTFNRLVTRVLRNRVVDYISSDADRYREFITGDFNQYLNNMRDRNTWGGEPEITAMGRMLGATINVDADGVVHTRGGGNISIRLYHVNAARSASQGNERNHYNFGLERNLHQQITNEVVPELVDHLCQIDENNNFKQRFQSFLDQVPRPSGVGAAPAKKGFYVNFFAGMFTTLKNTELFDRLELAELHFKLCTISDADEVPFLKIVAITEAPTTKKLEEYVFVISEKRYNRQIMGAIFSRDDRRWLEESRFLFSEGDDTYHLRSRAHTKAGEIEFKSGAAIIISKSNNRDRVNVRAEQLTDQELPERMRVKFRRIEKHHKHVNEPYASNLLEDIVKNLSKETVNNPAEDIKIVQAMERDAKKLFEYIYDINRKYHTRLPNIQGALEAADHGFTAGALINFKYRYNLELYLELLLGIEGYIDIALLVRGSQRVKKAMPILMEIKTGQEQGGRTNPQQALREAESYTQGLQQNNRPFVTLADRVVRVGFNMDYANPIEISMAELQPPAPIIRTIFESINNGDADVIRTTITNQLKKIYKLSPGVQGSSEPQYLSRLFIGHSILNTIENDETRIDKHVLTYKKLQQITRGTRRSHDITTSVFVERTIAGSNTGDSRVLVVHFHEGGRSNVDINDPTLRVPLNGIINQANCKEVIELYVDARSGNDGSLNFLTEDNGVIIQDFTNSVNDYFQANVANHWEIHNMPDFNQAGNLKKALDAGMSYQPQRDQNNKVDLGSYGDMFANIGKNLFSVKSLITSEAYFAAVLSGLLNSYSDIEFDQGDFKINVRPEFQVGGGERIDLFINVMSKNPADSDVLIGFELKYGDGRTTVDSMDKVLEKAEKVQLRRYGISRNIRAITEGANFFVTLPVGFISRAETPDSLVITRKQFVAYAVERSFLGQVHQLGRSIQRNEQTLESVTLQQNPDDRYWLSDQDIRRIAHLDNTYSNIFDVHAMNNNYDTSGRGLVVVTDRDQGINTGELREQIRQFIDNVDNNRIAQQQGVPTRTFIVNQGGDHWTTLVISQQNGQYHGYYADSLGSGIPDNIHKILTDNNIINPIDFQMRQQADGYNCGLWALENARDINTMLQENRGVQWLRAQLAPERLSRNSEQYFRDKRQVFAQVIHDNQAQVYSSRSSNTGSTSDSQVSSSQCLNGNRKKRSISKCLYSWDDVDKFNTEQQNKRNIDEIKIDSKKFLEYTKNIQDENKNSQLLELAKERLAMSDNNIVGKYKYLLNNVMQDGGYNSYIQNDRMKYLASDFSKSDARKINPKLKQRLLNAAGRIQLIRGIHSTIATCQDGSEGYCAFSVSGLGYSFLSQPIENIMVKITPKIVSKAASTAGKLVPRVLGYNTKFVIQIGGMKYGIKMARGAAGVLAGAFDIIDIVISSNALVLCANRKDSNDSCSDKEIRDNIASITFSSVSFIAGVGLTVAGAPLAATGVGLGLMVGYAIYSGVSNIIEYEEKYDTTHGENWSIFWRTILFQDMAKDIQHLADRTEMVNKITKDAWKNLEASSDDIVAYATGLGQIKYITKSCRVVPLLLIHKCDYTTIMDSSSAAIHMHNKSTNTENLSRVLPDPIQGATMICLPKITEYDYEKGLSQSRADAIYECDNAVVMIHDQRKNYNNNQWIIYDMKYINQGKILGSNKLHNIFLLFEGNTEIVGGANKNNKFIFTDSNNEFSGNIYLGNSTNILSTAQLVRNSFIKLEITYDFPIVTKELIRSHIAKLGMGPSHSDSFFTTLFPQPVPVFALSTSSNNLVRGFFSSYNFNLYYFGRKYKIDEVICQRRTFVFLGEGDISYPEIFIDSGGGLSNNQRDFISNCNRATIYPYTNIIGVNSTYTFYVRTEGYEGIISNSSIHVRGNCTIIFPKISLLEDCKKIIYSSKKSKTLSFEILLQNGTFTLDVTNYLSRNTSFVLMDKYGSNIIPKLDNNSTIINRFELHARHSLDNFNIAKDYYRKISYTEKDYQIFGVISSVPENNGEEFYKMLIGSSGTDVINLDKQTVFAEGGEGQDVYIVSNTSGESTVTINNKSEDKKFDILSVRSIDDVSLEQEGDDLSFFIEKKVNHTTGIDTIVVENYFLGNEYKHLLLVDKNRNSFIPFELSKDVVLVPFYHASSGENVFTLPVSVKQAVIDNDLEDIEFYRDSKDLLLLEKDIGENPNPLAVILKDFYSNLSQWKDHKIYSRNNNGDYDNYIELLQKSREALYYKEHESVVKEYIIDFRRSIGISHNQEPNENGTLTSLASDKEKIGIIILKNISPEQIRVFLSGNDLVLNDKDSRRTANIKNWCISEKYRVSILEFDLGLNPIRIHKLDKDSCSSSSLINKISYATQLYKTNKEMESLINPNIEYILRCIISINSVNITEAHITLGFASLQDQINFIQDCNFEKDTLTELKHVVKNKGVDLLSKYSSKLTSSLLLHDYGSDYIAKYMIIIRSILLEIPIISRIDEIIQENNDTLNHDYQGDDVGYVSDGSESRIQHHIKHSHLEVQVAEYVEKETSYSNYLPSITKVVGGIALVMLPIVGIVWYRHQNRPLNPEFFYHPEERARMIPLQVMTMVAGSATLLGGQNADAQQLYTECGKSEYLVDTSVEEVEADEDAAEYLVQNYLDDDYLSAEGPGLKETINDSTKHQRNHREINIENNQEQSLFSYKNNDHAHPMSSSVSRLEFWPINLVKSTWSIVIDAVNYLSSNSFEKGAQSLSNTNDTTKLGNSFKPYPSNMGNNTRSQHNSNSHEYATPPSSTKNQDVYCVPYSWDIESKKYVRDTMSCTSLSGQTKVFSNIHQSSNFVQDKDYSIGGDSYKNCRPVEFYGRPSVYCKGNHTNLIYAPNIQPRLFDSLDSNLMLGSVILRQVRKFYQWYQPTVEEETRYHLIVEITDQQLDDWNAQINKIKELLQYLKPSVSSKELQWAEYALIDHQEAISKLSSLSTASTEMIEILNENLQALLEDLAESKEESQDEIEKNINPIHHQHVKQNNSMNVNNNDQDSDDIISTIKDNNLKMLKAYLEAGKDANTFSRGGMTLLMRAVSNNCSTELVKLLIEYGADVNREDNDGETAINIASYNGHLELIKVLISEGAIIKNKTARNSPFNSVAESSMPQNIKDEIIKLLSNNLSSVDSSNNKLNKDHYVISNLVEQMSAMNSSNGNVGFSNAESTNIVPSYLGQNPNYHNEVIKVFA